MDTSNDGASWLLVILRQVRQRPGMYLGDERLGSLSCYVQGAVFALEHVGVAVAREERFLEAFGAWLGDKVGSRNGDCWFNLSLLPGATGNVAEFFDSLDEFLAEAGVSAGLASEQLDLSRWSARSD